MSNIMAEVNFKSEVLAMCSSMNVIIPQDCDGSYPVLWLLHGGGGNENDFLHNTKIRGYADKHNVAVVMPYAGYSRYCNMVWGADYFDFLTEELPHVVHHFFPNISTKREDNYIAGFSLGGSGAISLGMRRPDLYGTIGVLSASSIIPLEYLRPLSAGGPAAPGGEGRKSVNMINFGVENTGELEGNIEHDVLMNARKILADGKKPPKVFHAVGEGDHAYPVGLGLKVFFENIEGNPFDYEFHSWQGGHNDTFRDKALELFMDTVMAEREAK